MLKGLRKPQRVKSIHFAANYSKHFLLGLHFLDARVAVEALFVSDLGPLDRQEVWVKDSVIVHSFEKGQIEVLAENIISIVRVHKMVV